MYKEEFLNLVIDPTLDYMGDKAKERSRKLLLGTALVESNLRHLKQINGIALGVYQMERYPYRYMG